MTWACMAASGVGTLIFIDVVTHDGSSNMNSEVYQSILSANLRGNPSKLTSSCSNTMTPNRTGNTTKDTEHAFHLLKRGIKGKTNNN